MPGVKYSIDWNDLAKDGEVRKRLAKAVAGGRDMRPLFKRAGEIMVQSVAKTFASAEGGGPGRARWARHSPYTTAMREWRAEHGGHPFHKQILVQGADLKQKWTYNVYRDHVDSGSPIPYAKLHQFGGTIKAPKRWKRSTAKVPARTLIQFFPDDLKHIQQQTEVFLEEPWK